MASTGDCDMHKVPARVDLRGAELGCTSAKGGQGEELGASVEIEKKLGVGAVPFFSHKGRNHNIFA